MKTKNIVIAVLVVVVVAILGVMMNLKKAYELREYAITHNCTWTYQGTAYGDDRDYVCK